MNMENFNEIEYPDKKGGFGEDLSSLDEGSQTFIKAVESANDGLKAELKTAKDDKERAKIQSLIDQNNASLKDFYDNLSNAA